MFKKKKKKKIKYMMIKKTDQLVLVGCDGDEGRLGEDKGTMYLGLQTLTRGRGLAVPLPDYVHAGLVLVHRVEDNLKISIELG